VPHPRAVGLLPRRVVWSAVAVVLVASYLPLAAVLASAMEGGVTTVLQHALSVLTDARRRGLLTRSALIAAGATLSAVGVGVPVALLVRHAAPRARFLLGSTLILPLVVPTYVFALGWQRLVDPTGPLARFAGAFGAAGLPLPDLATAAGVVAVLALRYLPLVVLGASTGFTRVDPALEDAARLVHPPPWVLARVVLPLARPEIVASGLVVFNLALVNYTVPSLLRVPTFPVEIFAAFSGLLDVQAAVGLSLPLLAVGTLSVVAARLVVGKRPLAVAARRTPPEPLPAGSRLVATRTALFVLLAITVAAPLAGIADMVSGPQSVVEAYRLAAPQVWRTVGWAMVAATLLAAHGLAAGHLVARSRSLAAELLFLLPLALSPTVLGIGLIRLWNRPYLEGVLETTAVLLLVYVGQLVPFTAVPATASLAGVPRALEEAGMLSGMGWLQRMRLLLLPLAWRGVAVGWLLAFALSLDEVGASILVQPPDGETLAVRIYNLSHYGAAESVGALCLIVLAIVAVPLLVVGLVTLRRSSALLPSAPSP